MNWRLVVAVLCLAGGALAQTPLPNPIPIVISGPGPWIDVKAYGAVGNGSANDHDAIQNAIDACPVNGCTIYFPSSGSYNIATGLHITSSQPGIKLLGECGAPGTLTPEKCSHLISSAGIVLLTVGASGSQFHSGLVIQDIGFRETSGSAAAGAIQLINTMDFNLTNVHCRDITAGFCFLFDGGGTGTNDFTQFGVVINPSVVNVKFPVQTNNQASEINLYGGNLDCNGLGSSIGMDLGKTNPTTGSSTGGEWGVFGTHILSCDTGISMWNNSNMNYYGVMEKSSTAPKGTAGVVIDGNTPNKPSRSIIAGSISNVITGVLLDHEAVNNRILADIQADNPIVIGASHTTNTLPSTLILTTANYAGTSGAAIGSQMRDLTIPSESAPPVPAAGSRRLYVDSGTGKNNDLSVERSDGTIIDLEGGLLSYQKATGSSIQGNGLDQTVYSFSIPAIPAGKGIRAKVFWQCTIGCSSGNKIFSWQFGATKTSYAAYTTNLANLAYAEVNIFNDPGSQTQQTMFGDAITLGASFVASGILSTPGETTTGAVSLTFLFKAPSSETIFPKGFTVEAIQ